MPNSIAVLGDSMSVATGTQGIPASEQPQNSWSTGTNSSVNSLYQRILALNSGISGKNRNKAGNGEDMNDGPNQANSVESDTELITVQLGGNNLCKGSVNEMTTVAQYRTSFINTLNNLQSRAPNALIQVQSVPDIYNLWFLRGAPNPPNSQPSSRAGTARVFWDTLSLIPCESLVNNPTSMSEGDLARRDLVRQRNLEFNRVLAEECEARLRCRFDRYATFVFSANRSNPFIDPARTDNYLPRNEWQFVDDDISTIDHFHPSTSGQRKMAQAAWESGYQFTDSTMPNSTVSKSPAPLQSGTSFLPTTVNLTWSDAAGIKGVQYRTHVGGTTSAWTTQLGTLTGSVIDNQTYGYLNQKSFSVAVSTPGITYIESRAMDANGNLSASRITEVNYDPDAIPAPQIIGKPSENTASTAASFTFTGVESGLSYECSLDGAAFTACTSPHSLSSLGSGDHQFRVRLKSSLATGPAAIYNWHVDTSAPGAPTIIDGPPVNSNNSNANFFFSGTEAVLECSVDGAAFTPCTSPRLVPVASDGVHSFSVRQKNVLGTPGDSATYHWTLDRTAPEAPVFGEGPTSPTNETSAEIHFSGEPGGTFSCTLTGPGGTQINNCTSPRNLSGLLEGTHTLSVRQKDALENQGPSASFTWTVDTTAPAAPVIESGPPAETTSRDATVAFSGEPGGHFECALDDASFFFCSSPRELTGLEDGEHTLRIRQVDEAGNSGAASTRSWTVDGTPPAEPELTVAAPVLTNSADASFSFTGESGSSFECAVDEGGFAACSSPHEISGLNDGNHQFKVRQTDGFGNTGPESSHSWTVDTTPPAAPTISPLTLDLNANPQRQISFSGEPGGSFECRINEGSWASCASLWVATFPGPGKHSFDVRQIDDAANTGPAARGNVTVWAGPPSTPVITSAPSGTVRSTSAEVRFTAGPVGTPECSLNDSSWQPCNGVWSADNLRQGPQTLVIVQRNETVGQSVSVQWTVDTVAPKLTGKPRARAKGKTRKGKPRNWVLRTNFNRGLGRPATLEYSTAKKKPKSAAVPVRARSRKWSAKLTIKSKKKLSWVRVLDPIGNASPWVRVR